MKGHLVVSTSSLHVIYFRHFFLVDPSFSHLPTTCQYSVFDNLSFPQCCHHQCGNQSLRGGREGRAADCCLSPFPRPTLRFYTKKTKYAASVITNSPSRHWRGQDVDVLSPKMLPEVPGFLRREGPQGWFCLSSQLSLTSHRGC